MLEIHICSGDEQWRMYVSWNGETAVGDRENPNFRMLASSRRCHVVIHSVHGNSQMAGPLCCLILRENPISLLGFLPAAVCS
jgi:hypothetical protein